MQNRSIKICNQIDELKNLQPGWFDGEGNKFDNDTLDYLKDFIIRSFENSSITYLYIYPKPQADVSVECDFSNVCITLLFNTKDKIIEFSIINLYDDNSVYETFPMKESSIELIKNQLKNLEE